MATASPFIFAAAAAFIAASAPINVASAKVCSCRYDGGRVQVGELVCIKRGDRLELAVCAMNANNTTWTFLGRDCNAFVS